MVLIFHISGGGDIKSVGMSSIVNSKRKPNTIINFHENDIIFLLKFKKLNERKKNCFQISSKTVIKIDYMSIFNMATSKVVISFENTKDGLSPNDVVNNYISVCQNNPPVNILTDVDSGFVLKQILCNYCSINRFNNMPFECSQNSKKSPKIRIWSIQPLFTKDTKYTNGYIDILYSHCYTVPTEGWEYIKHPELNNVIQNDHHQLSNQIFSLLKFRDKFPHIRGVFTMKRLHCYYQNSYVSKFF